MPPMPPKEGKAPATTHKRSEDRAVVDVRLRVIIMRPTGAALERLIDLAKKRPEFLGDYVKAEMTANIDLAFIEVDDGSRVALDESFWRTMQAANPAVLRWLVRALGDVITS